jgi:hypothetical protein
MTFTPPGEEPPPPSAPPPAPPVPGWWLASDGNWYPPETKPGAPMPYRAPPTYGSAPPAYGSPPVYGSTTPYGYTPYQAPRGTNGFAIASMVLGIVWIYWIGSVLAIIFGFVAYSQIKERNQRGRGMATAGLILGFIGIGLLVLAVLVTALGSSSTVKFSSVGSSIGG